MALKRRKRTDHDLEDLLNAVELELGIHLSVLDCHAILRRPDGTPLIAEHRLSRNHIPVCGSQLSTLCQEECIHSLDHRAQSESRPFVASCWKQLIELVVPVRSGGNYLGVLTAGVWQPEQYEQDEWSEGELQEWQHATRMIPVFDPTRIERLGKILDGIAFAVATIWEESIECPVAALEAREIIRFIRCNYWYPLRLSELAQHLGISSSHASHMVSGYFGRSFREIIRDERLNAAKLLLKRSDYLVGEISTLVGIADEQHFNRLFKKVCGISPGQYRKAR